MNLASSKTVLLRGHSVSQTHLVYVGGIKSSSNEKSQTQQPFPHCRIEKKDAGGKCRMRQK